MATKSRLPVAAMNTPSLHRNAAAAMGPSMDADACLALRPASVECGLCRDACPRSAIEWAEATVRVSDACVDCGRCAAVCPSAAMVFKAAGMHHVALDPTAGPLALRVECQRVPPQSHSKLRGFGSRIRGPKDGPSRPHEPRALREPHRPDMR